MKTIVIVQGAEKCIGKFRTELEAAKAYNNYVVKEQLDLPLNIF
jgi:hypothetical protein